MEHNSGSPGPISVFLADDNLIVREGVRALINARRDLKVVGVAADYDELVAGADATEPQVIVTDIRMPPTYPPAVIWPVLSTSIQARSTFANRNRSAARSSSMSANSEGGGLS